MSAKIPLIRFVPIIKINDDEEGEETHIMNWMAVPRARTDAAEATGATGQDSTAQDSTGQDSAAQDSPDSDDPTLCIDRRDFVDGEAAERNRAHVALPAATSSHADGHAKVCSSVREPSSAIPNARRRPPPPLWRRLATLFANFFRRRRVPRSSVLAAPPPLPDERMTAPRRAGCKAFSVVEEVLLLVWQLDSSDLQAIERLAAQILAARAVGPGELVKAHVLYLLGRTQTGAAVPLWLIRSRLNDVPRAVLDAAFLHLEAAGHIALLPASQNSGFREQLASISHPTLGVVDHCALWERPARCLDERRAA